MNSLSTPEKFLILAHHPEKMRFMISHIHLKYGLAGAILLELTLDGSVEMQDDRIVLIKRPSSGQTLMNEIAGLLSEISKPRRIRYWIRRLGRIPGRYKWRVLGDLERRRVIRIEERRLMGMFPYRVSFLMNRKLQNDLIREARSNVLQKKDPPPNEWVAVLGLIQACGMHRIISTDRSERKMIRKKVKKILEESPIASGVDQTIRQVQVAIVASVAASSAAAASAGGR
ncbi:MAG: GOLPH3/VPS74 family protein [Bacteroidales bacterium]